MDYKKQALIKHEAWQGKIEVVSRVTLASRDDLATAYTPGVAEPCLKIQAEPNLSYAYTRRANLVAVITDGSAVLGLGNIGGLAGMPVMEGKCILFKEFADIDAFPICVKNQSADEIVSTIINISDSFGGINLEDISAPRCFEIENRLKQALDIPVFHDDQHGTAIVTLAGLINSLKIVNKDFKNVRVCVSGPGAAGSAIIRLLMKYGVGDAVMCDRSGILHRGRENMDWSKTELAQITNRDNIKGDLAAAIKGSDIFVGVSGPGIVSAQMVKSMNKDSVIFAMSNPVPEIYPADAIAAGAKVVGTGRSDFANQINNVLAFPGVFRGAFDCRAKAINDNMKIAAAEAIASLVTSDELKPDYIIPDALDKRVAPHVAKKVCEQAIKDGLNQI